MFLNKADVENLGRCLPSVWGKEEGGGGRYT